MRGAENPQELENEAKNIKRIQKPGGRKSQNKSRSSELIQRIPNYIKI